MANGKNKTKIKVSNIIRAKIQENKMKMTNFDIFSFLCILII